MTSKKKIWMQGIVASVITIGALGAWVFTPQYNKVSTQAASVEYIMEDAAELDKSLDNVGRITRSRAMEEHGEIMSKGPAGDEVVGPLMLSPPPRMGRAAAMQRAEDLVAVRDNPAEPIEVRQNADRLLGEHLEQYFPAAGPEPEDMRAEPKNGDHDSPSLYEVFVDTIPLWVALLNAFIGFVTWRRLKGAGA